MNLSGKTRSEIAAALAPKSRAELVELIVSLLAFDRLLTAREISEASHVSKRDVLADMRLGRFIDPLLGRGFFCRAANSLKVSASAANAWRRSFFVPVPSLEVGKHPDLADAIYRRDSITGHKKSPPFPSLLASEENKRRRALQTDHDGENSPAKGRRLIRTLSPEFLGLERL